MSNNTKRGDTMTDKEKLQYIISHIEEALDDTRDDKELRIVAGLYGDDGHVGDDDEDIVGMLWIEEKLSDTESRCWNVRVKLDD
jgi:hypothetical protein